MKLYLLLSLTFLIVGCNASRFNVSEGANNRTGQLSVSASSIILQIRDLIENFADPGKGAGEPFLLSDGRIFFITPGSKKIYIKDPLANSGAGSFTELTPLSQLANRPTLILLPNDKMLILGGHDNMNVVLNTVDLYDPNGAGGLGSVTSLAPMNNARYMFGATLLNDGKILISGGRDPSNNTIPNVELYDPSGAGSSTELTPLSTNIEQHFSFKMADGKVLMLSLLFNRGYLYDSTGVGSFYEYSANLPASRYYGHQAIKLIDDRIFIYTGTDGSNVPLDDIEIFDPAGNAGTGSTTVMTSLPKGVGYGKAVVLSTGKVLIVQGEWNRDVNQKSVFLYDPAGAGSYQTLTELEFPRESSMGIVKISDTSILVVGGGSGRAEEYNPTANSGSGGTINPAQALATSYHTSSLLTNGKVLVTGGYNDKGDGFDYVQLFTPGAQGESGTMVTLNNLNYDRVGHLAVPLSNGKVILFGGEDINNTPTNTVEIYDPSAAAGLGASTTLTPMLSARAYQTGHLLDNGKIILIGGSNENWDNITSVEIYDPSGGGSSVALTPMNIARGWFHRSTLLSTGKILISGGYDVAWNITNTVEIYDPEAAAGAGSSTNLTNMNSYRYSHGAFALENGSVLLIGGNDENDEPQATAELYNPAGVGSTTNLASFTNARNYASIELLPSGKVIIAGGYQYIASQSVRVLDVEIYDPASGGSSSTVPGAEINSNNATTTVLSDGRVWFFGGYGEVMGYNSDWSFFSQAESAQLSTTGGDGNYVYAISSGSGTLTSTGLFTPFAVGSTTIGVTDGNGKTGTVSITAQ